MPSVIGQDLTASGFDPGLASPPMTFGAWGDSGTGTGVVGSSSSAAPQPAAFGGAGVYGINDAAGGLGVCGRAGHQSGAAVLGTSTHGTGVVGSSSSGIGVTAESTGTAALHARRPAAGGAAIEVRLATPQRAAEFSGDVDVSGTLTVGIGAGSACLRIGASTTRSDNFHWTSDVNSGPRALRLYNGDYGAGTRLLSVTAEGNVGAGPSAPLARMHVSHLGGFGAEDATGALLSSQVPLLTQSDSTTLGVLNADGRAVFALNIDENQHTSDRRGVPTFYDRYDGTWHPGISLRNGNVGLGTADPAGRLQVVGGAIVPAVGNHPGAGIQFPANPGGGGGDEAFLRYHAVAGETTRLVMGVGNDPDDAIALWQFGAERLTIRGGMVGIGTSTPDTQLTVATGARLNGVVAGTASPAVSYDFGYETVGVSQQPYNLRLQSPNWIFFHTGGNPPGARAGIDDLGRVGTIGHSPTPRNNGWGGGLHTWDVEAEGSIWCANDIYAKRFVTESGDVAERFPGIGRLEAGDVVCVADHDANVAASQRARAATVVGVVSAGAGVILAGPQPGAGSDHSVAVALCGRVPCKASAENGSIRPGDLLTSASAPGHAMRADHETDRAAIIGKALTPLAAGTGLIEVLVATG